MKTLNNNDEKIKKIELIKYQFLNFIENVKPDYTKIYESPNDFKTMVDFETFFDFYNDFCENLNLYKDLDIIYLQISQHKKALIFVFFDDSLNIKKIYFNTTMNLEFTDDISAILYIIDDKNTINYCSLIMQLILLSFGDQHFEKNFVKNPFIEFENSFILMDFNINNQILNKYYKMNIIPGCFPYSPNFEKFKMYMMRFDINNKYIGYAVNIKNLNKCFDNELKNNFLIKFMETI